MPVVEAARRMPLVHAREVVTMTSTGQATAKKAAESAQRAREFATAWEAYDACAAINPSNPLAVANEIEEAFNIIRDRAIRGEDARCELLMARLEKRQ